MHQMNFRNLCILLLLPLCSFYCARSMDTLPKDNMNHIVSYIENYEDLYTLSLVSKKLYMCATDNIYATARKAKYKQEQYNLLRKKLEDSYPPDQRAHSHYEIYNQNLVFDDYKMYWHGGYGTFLSMVQSKIYAIKNGVIIDNNVYDTYRNSSVQLTWYLEDGQVSWGYLRNNNRGLLEGGSSPSVMKSVYLPSTHTIASYDVEIHLDRTEKEYSNPILDYPRLFFGITQKVNEKEKYIQKYYLKPPCYGDMGNGEKKPFYTECQRILQKNFIELSKGHHIEPESYSIIKHNDLLIRLFVMHTGNCRRHRKVSVDHYIAQFYHAQQLLLHKRIFTPLCSADEYNKRVKDRFFKDEQTEFIDDFSTFKTELINVGCKQQKSYIRTAKNFFVATIYTMKKFFSNLF
jgi:hypothetical protein